MSQLVNDSTRPKFVGIGASGCVVSGQLKCMSNKNDPVYDQGMDIVTKVMSNESSTEEYGIYNDLNNPAKYNLPNIDRVLIRPIGMCTPNSTDKNFVAAVQTCGDEYTRRNNGMSKLDYISEMNRGIIQISENGGPDLYDFIYDKLPNLPSSDIWDFLLALQNLFEALRVLNENGIIHRDIKMQNVVYNASKRQVKLIDIGLVVPDRNVLLHECMAYDFDELGECSYFPPEIYLWNRREFKYQYPNDDDSFMKFMNKSIDSFDIFCTANTIQTVFEFVIRLKDSNTNEYILKINNTDPNGRREFLNRMTALCRQYTEPNLSIRNTSIGAFAREYKSIIAAYLA